MKTITPPLGLLEFLDRVQSNAKIYEIKSTADQLSVALGCRDEDILAASLILHPHRAPRISVHPWNQNADIQDNERCKLNELSRPAEKSMDATVWTSVLHSISTSVLESPCLYIPAGM